MREQLIKDHKKWDMPVIPYLEAVSSVVSTIPLGVVMNNRHETPVSRFVTFVERRAFPINDEYWLEILPGYTTDWASIPDKPKFLKKLLKYNSQDIRRAAVTHDALFNHKGPIGYRESNKIFKRIMLEDGASEFKAALCYFGVATPIGKWHWNMTAPFDVFNRQFSVIHRHDKLPMEV